MGVAGVRFPVVLGAAGVCFGPGRALQFRGSAVRFGRRNSTGISASSRAFVHLRSAAKGSSQNFWHSVGKGISSSRLVSAFPGIGDLSCTWLQGPEGKALSGEPFH